MYPHLAGVEAEIERQTGLVSRPRDEDRAVITAPGVVGGDVMKGHVVRPGLPFQKAADPLLVRTVQHVDANPLRLRQHAHVHG